MTIINSYIKKKENKEWLSNNYESFIYYMSTHHSMNDCWHTILNMSTFNDAYVEKMITEIESSEKRREKEEKIRKAKRNGKKVSTLKETTAVEKKIAELEEKTAAIQKDSWDDGELLD
jgi:predicted ribosome quality control (RQC) complex YloA/Tae2 family protein